MVKETIQDGGFTINVIDMQNNYREVITKDGNDRQYAMVLGMGNDMDSFIAYNYLSDGNGLGDPLYCSSKGGYRTLKGARKKAKSYLTR